MGLSRTKTSEILNCFDNFCCPEVNLLGPMQVKRKCRSIARPSLAGTPVYTSQRLPPVLLFSSHPPTEPPILDPGCHPLLAPPPGLAKRRWRKRTRPAGRTEPHGRPRSVLSAFPSGGFHRISLSKFPTQELILSN